MILSVSDWHLGYKRCNLDAIVDFLDHYQNTEIEHFILLEDIYDFWRRNNADLIKENDEIMAKLNDLKAKNIYYVAGNHDYYISDLNKKYNHGYEGISSKYQTGGWMRELLFHPWIRDGGYFMGISRKPTDV